MPRPADARLHAVGTEPRLIGGTGVRAAKIGMGEHPKCANFKRLFAI